MSKTYSPAEEKELDKLLLAGLILGVLCAPVGVVLLNIYLWAKNPVLAFCLDAGIVYFVYWLMHG